MQSIGDWVVEDFVLREVDLVFDCIGGLLFVQFWYVVKDGGSFISVCGELEKSCLQDVEKKVDSLWFVIIFFGKDLDVMVLLLDSGKFKLSIDSVVELGDFVEVWDKVELGQVRGKVVVKIFDKQSNFSY